MTPLDFRLIAPVIFRLLAIHCTTVAGTLDNVSAAFLSEQLIGTKLISRDSLTSQARVLLDTLRGEMFGSLGGSATGEFFTNIVRMSHTYSAVHTNGFIWSVPGSDDYQLVDNYYPLHSDASFDNVSDHYHL